MSYSDTSCYCSGKNEQQVVCTLCACQDSSNKFSWLWAKLKLFLKQVMAMGLVIIRWALIPVFVQDRDVMIKFIIVQRSDLRQHKLSTMAVCFTWGSGPVLPVPGHTQWLQPQIFAEGVFSLLMVWVSWALFVSLWGSTHAGDWTEAYYDSELVWIIAIKLL